MKNVNKKFEKRQPAEINLPPVFFGNIEQSPAMLSKHAVRNNRHKQAGKRILISYSEEQESQYYAALIFFHLQLYRGRWKMCLPQVLSCLLTAGTKPYITALQKPVSAAIVPFIHHIQKTKARILQAYMPLDTAAGDI